MRKTNEAKVSSAAQVQHEDAVFAGWQETGSGDAFALYTITAATNPSRGSTVSDRTLMKMHLHVPDAPPRGVPRRDTCVQSIAADAWLRPNVLVHTAAGPGAVHFPSTRKRMKDSKAGEEQIPVTHGKVPGHRRGSSSRFQDPGEVLNEQGNLLPPHLQEDQGLTTKPHAPRHPRSNRIRPTQGGPEPYGPMSPLPGERIPQ